MKPVSSETTASKQLLLVQRKALVVVLANAASTLMFIALGFILINQTKPVGVTLEIRNIMYGSALVLALASVFARRTMFQMGRLQSVATKRGVTGVLNHLMRATVISAALGETIALLGLVLGIMGGDRFDVVRFCVVACAVVLFSAPKRDAWARMIEYLDQSRHYTVDASTDY